VVLHAVKRARKEFKLHREEALGLFLVGYLDLRAQLDEIYGKDGAA